MPEFSISLRDFKLQLPLSMSFAQQPPSEADFIASFFDSGSLKREYSYVAVTDFVCLHTSRYGIKIPNTTLIPGVYSVLKNGHLEKLDNMEFSPVTLRPSEQIFSALVEWHDIQTLLALISSLETSFVGSELVLSFTATELVFSSVTSAGVVIATRGLRSQLDQSPITLQIHMSAFAELRSVFSVFPANAPIELIVYSSGELGMLSHATGTELLWKTSQFIEKFDYDFKNNYQLNSCSFLISPLVLQEVLGDDIPLSFLTYYPTHFIQFNDVNFDIKPSEKTPSNTPTLDGIYIPAQITDTQSLFILQPYAALIRYYLNIFGNCGIEFMRPTDPEKSIFLMHLFPVVSTAVENGVLNFAAYSDVALSVTPRVMLGVVTAKNETLALVEAAKTFHLPVTLLQADISDAKTSVKNKALTAEDVMALHDSLKKSIITLLKEQGVAVKYNDPRTITQLMYLLNTSKSLFDDI